jgi:HK97 family phage major capsid protein
MSNAKALSLNERVDAVRTAIYRVANGRMPTDEWYDCYVELVYDGYAIVRGKQPGQYYRVDYALTDEGIEVAEYTNWQRVEQAWAAKALQEQVLIAYGGALKSVGDGRVEGYLVRFSTADDPDLAGDFFTAETDFDIEDGQKTTLYYDHGLDSELGRRKVGKGTLKKDKVGVWLEAQLERRDDYEKAIYTDLVCAGKAGLSSGTASHLVERVREGKAYRITHWPLGLDASITPTPMEPRTSVLPMKSYIAGTVSPAPEATPQAAGEAAGVVAPEPIKTASPSIIISTPEKESTPMSAVDNQTAEIAGLKGQLDAITALLSRFETEPSIRNAGFVSPDGGTADKNIKSFADYLVAVKRSDHKRLTEHYGSTKALSENDGTAGGYTVPKEFRNDLLSIEGEDVIVRPRAYVQPMTTKTLEIPALDQSAAPTAGTNSGLYAGVTARWTEEGGTSTATDPKFRSLQLTAHELTGHTYASNALLADSAQGLEALLKKLFGGAVLWTTDYACLRGNGVGKPLGAIGAQNPAAISVARTGGGNSFELADAKAMKKRLLRSSSKRAVWVMHPFIESDLIDLALSGTTQVTYMPNLTAAPPLSLLGIPVVFSDSMAAPGSAGDVGLCDFSHYVIGDRQDLAISMSEHAAFTSGQIVWRFQYRMDGQPWLNAPVYLADGVNTVSPFVYLS